MDKLRRYIQQNELTLAKLSKHIGISGAALGRYINKQRFPNREIILKIEKATDGYVRPSDWYVDNTAQSPRTGIVAQKDERKVNNDKKK